MELNGHFRKATDYGGLSGFAAPTAIAFTFLGASTGNVSFLFAGTFFSMMSGYCLGRAGTSFMKGLSYETHLGHCEDLPTPIHDKKQAQIHKTAQKTGFFIGVNEALLHTLMHIFALSYALASFTPLVALVVVAPLFLLSANRLLHNTVKTLDGIREQNKQENANPDTSNSEEPEQKEDYFKNTKLISSLILVSSPTALALTTLSFITGSWWMLGAAALASSISSTVSALGIKECVKGVNRYLSDEAEQKERIEENKKTPINKNFRCAIRYGQAGETSLHFTMLATAAAYISGIDLLWVVPAISIISTSIFTRMTVLNMSKGITVKTAQVKRLSTDNQQSDSDDWRPCPYQRTGLPGLACA